MDIQMINSQTGYTSGWYGTLLKTTNAGQNWINLNIPTTKDVESLFFFNENTGYIGGGVGLLAKTTNGGINWEFKNFDTTKRLMSIYFKNNNEGYIGCRYGGLFRTSNGGTNWTNLDTQNIYIINKFYFSTTSTGYASGVYKSGSSYLGVFLKSTDNGLNWSMNHPPNYSPYASMKFFNPNTGYIGGDVLFYTTNGSATWNAVNKPTGSIYAFYFKDFYNGYIINWFQSENPKIFKTINGGISWENLNILNNYYFYEISGINDTLYISGYLGEMAHSYNGGTNWIYNEINHSSLYSVYFFNYSTGWVCGSNGTLLYTDNGGELWQKKYFPDSSASLLNILFVNNNTGFIGANYGRIFRTLNAGNNWDSFTAGTATFFYLSFINASTGFASTYLGEIYRTTNTGDNWNLFYNFNETFYKDIHFFSEIKGIIIKSLGGNSAILLTTDGGLSWNNVLTPELDLFDLYFVNNNTGYTCGAMNIYKTTNGGFNWQLLTTYNSAFMYSICSKENKVWASGGSGKIMFSSNSGVNWQYQNSKTNQTLNCIFFLDTNTGYICGNAGYIAKTTNSGTVFISKINSAIPQNFFLEQNYPNPFNSSTIIKFHIPKTVSVQIKLYDILGREIMTLVNESKSSGIYEVLFDATLLPSGIYFYRFTTENYSNTKKMLLIK